MWPFVDLETHSFLSPLYYNALLGLVLLGKRIRIPLVCNPINPTFHNYNMVFQSVVLLSLACYTYIDVANTHDMVIFNFVGVSNRVADVHKTQSFPLVLYIFLVSKVFEWFDTVLLIVNNKKVIPLHWWHHSTIGVAFYTGYFCSSLIWIGSLNSLIHIVMYLYYADFPGVRSVARYLTQLQIIQLFGGVCMNYVSFQYTTDPKYKFYSMISLLICLSYGLMFVQFYMKRYSHKKKE